MEGINTDKVKIHVGGGTGGDAGAMAAVIAALGNRNEGSDNAALIAALGNRNDNGLAALAPLLASSGGLGGGMGGVWPILLLALLGGRGRGLLGGDDCVAGGNLAGEFLMSKLGSIEGAIPLAASGVSREICESTASLNNAIQQATLANLAASTGVKDSVQNGVTTLLANSSNQTEKVLSAIAGLGSKIDQNTIADLNRQLAVAQSAVSEERSHSRAREVEVTVSQNVSQSQAQAQVQAQLASLLGGFSGLQAQMIQNARANQDIVNLGTMLASGTQANTSTQVR